MRFQKVFYIDKGTVLFNALVSSICKDQFDLNEMNPSSSVVSLAFHSGYVSQSPIAAVHSKPKKMEQGEIIYRVYPNGNENEEYELCFRPITKSSPKDDILDLTPYFEEYSIHLSPKMIFRSSLLKELFQKIYSHHVGDFVTNNLNRSNYEDEAVKSHQEFITTSFKVDQLHILKFKISNFDQLGGDQHHYRFEYRLAEAKAKEFVVTHDKGIGHGWFQLIKGIKIVNRLKVVGRHNKEIYREDFSQDKLKNQITPTVRVIFEKNNFTQENKNPVCISTRQVFDYGVEYSLSLSDLSQVLVSACKVKFLAVQSTEGIWNEFHVRTKSNFKNDFAINKLNEVHTPLMFDEGAIFFLDHKSTRHYLLEETDHIAFFEIEISGDYSLHCVNYSIYYDFLSSEKTDQVGFEMEKQKKLIIGNKNDFANVFIRRLADQATGSLTFYAITNTGFKNKIGQFDLPKDIVSNRNNRWILD